MHGVQPQGASVRATGGGSGCARASAASDGWPDVGLRARLPAGVVEDRVVEHGVVEDRVRRAVTSSEGAGQVWSTARASSRSPSSSRRT